MAVLDNFTVAELRSSKPLADIHFAGTITSPRVAGGKERWQDCCKWPAFDAEVRSFIVAEGRGNNFQRVLGEGAFVLPSADGLLMGF